MRKFHFFWLVSGIAFLMVSCQREASPAPQQLKNAFSYGGGISPIESIVYTAEEKEGCHVFYISPTAGLLDTETAQLADDYIKITVQDPSGAVDLYSGENEVEYKDVHVSSSSSSEVSSASLSVNLTSSRTLRLSLDVRMTSGQTLKAEYDGFCVKYPADPSGYDVVMDKAIYAYYFGQASAGTTTHNYYFTLTDAEYTADMSSGSPDYELKEEGYVLILDMFSDLEDGNWKTLPDGVYSASNGYGDHTYTVNYSVAFHFDSDGNRTQLLLAGPLSVETDETGVTTISGTFYENGAERTFAFRSTLQLTNGLFNPSLPQIGEDVHVKGVYAEGLYNGNLMGSGTGMMQINIYDENAANDRNGYTATVVVFNKLFGDSASADIIPGEYVAGSDFSIGTWMPAQELNYMGMIFPYGTFVLYNDGSEDGKYMYGSAGNVSIESISTSEGPGFRIEFEIQSFDGYTMTCEFEGPVEVYDESDDPSTDDGTSSLEQDIEVELDDIACAYLSPQTQIYVPALGYIDVAQFNSGLQFIDIGNATRRPVSVDEDGNITYSYSGDAICLELLVTNGMSDRIVPGIYTVCPQRYNGYFEPFVSVTGYSSATGMMGTRYLGLREIYGSKWVDENGDGIQQPDEVLPDQPLGVATLDQFAAVKSGSVTVSESDKGEGWYKFDFNFFCTREHNITGTWEGPVYYSGSTNPVPCAEETASAQSSEKVRPSLRELAPYYLMTEKVPVKQRFN